MILWRVLPRDPAAADEDEGGALWFPRALQGAGRHDNPDRYGALYLATQAHAAVAETLAPFRGSGARTPGVLTRAGRPLTLAALSVDDEVELRDLDDPEVLSAEALRPSVVATRRRPVTRGYARRLFDQHPGIGGLTWWSTLESSWLNVTLFDRAGSHLAIEDLTLLELRHPAVVEAAAALGLV